MKRLILIQNDFSGSGKTTLMRALQRYLDRHQAPHLALCVTESLEDAEDTIHRLPVESLYRDGIAPFLKAADLVLVEVESGLSETVSNYLTQTGSLASLADNGVEVLIALPVTGDEESFDAVVSAAHAFGDQAQYAVFHVPTGSEYDDDDTLWDHSKGARLMDLLDGVDLTVPTPSPALEAELHSIDLDLASAMNHSWSQLPIQGLMAGWEAKMAAQLDPARRFLFGDAFRPAVAVIDRQPARRHSKGKRAPAALSA